MKSIFGVVALAAALAAEPAASALTVTFVSGNLSSRVVDVDEIAKTVFIRENHDGQGPVVWLFEGMDSGNWTITVRVNNVSPEVWNSFGFELLNDDYSESDDSDGLSFDQGGSIARTSTVFATLFVDEVSSRDYLNWYDGVIGTGGGAADFGFGIDPPGDLSSFYLVNTPNLARVPEPAAWAMLIAGFGLVGNAMRRKALLI